MQNCWKKQQIRDNMRLWTIQPVEVVNILERDGVFTCNPEKSEYYNDFHDAYLWIAVEMDKRNITHPDGLKLPLWAWHTRDWKHKKPDLRTTGLGTPGKSYACIEFEINDKDVLLSDYGSWHYVLNHIWFDNSYSEDDWNKKQEWFDSLNPKEKENVIVKSWQNIFNVAKKKNDWFTNGRYVQATFWELQKDMITNIRYFESK